LGLICRFAVFGFWVCKSSIVYTAYVRRSALCFFNKVALLLKKKKKKKVHQNNQIFHVDVHNPIQKKLNLSECICCSNSKSNIRVCCYSFFIIISSVIRNFIHPSIKFHKVFYKAASIFDFWNEVQGKRVHSLNFLSISLKGTFVYISRDRTRILGLRGKSKKKKKKLKFWFWKVYIYILENTF
jgi:hypothetical protein